MFSSEERERIRIELLKTASEDQRISAGAITGSASIDQQDQWSDIDLAFGVKQPNEILSVLKDFTEQMYDKYCALHHLNVLSGTCIYRVFFLASTLQVDLAFAPQTDFGARAPTFKLVFGTANNISHDPPAAKDTLVG